MAPHRGATKLLHGSVAKWECGSGGVRSLIGDSDDGD